MSAHRLPALPASPWLGGLVALVSLSLPHPGHADEAKRPPAESVKRRYVDVPRAVMEVEEGRAAAERLKRDLDERQQRITRMENALKEKKESLDKQRAVMKAETRQQKEEEFQRELIELQKTAMQLEQEHMESRSQVFEEIRKKVVSLVNKIYDREGLDEIAKTEAFECYKRHLDITDAVIRDYNRQFGKK